MVNAPTVQEKLTRLIDEACQVGKTEPDLDLALEICDLIVSKTSLAYFATSYISKYFASEDEIQCLLALFLTDMMVVNCGYPMHLVISKPAFLNKLVYRFPPNSSYLIDKTHEQVLYMLEKWRQALCIHSKYAAEFGRLFAMHALLKNKGFEYPTIELAEIEAIIGNASSELRTLDEIEREQRTYREAKLEDCLRRGTSADLKMANELMKILSETTESNYGNTSKVLSSLKTVREKVELLEQLFWNSPNTSYSDNDSIKILKEGLKVDLKKLERFPESDLDGSIMEEVFELVERISKAIVVAEGSNSATKDVLVQKKKINSTKNNEKIDSTKDSDKEGELISFNDTMSNTIATVAELANRPTIGLERLCLDSTSSSIKSYKPNDNDHDNDSLSPSLTDILPLPSHSLMNRIEKKVTYHGPDLIVDLYIKSVDGINDNAIWCLVAFNHSKDQKKNVHVIFDGNIRFQVGNLNGFDAAVAIGPKIDNLDKCSVVYTSALDKNQDELPKSCDLKRV